MPNKELRDCLNSAKETVGYLRTKLNQFKLDTNNYNIFEDRYKALQVVIDFCESRMDTPTLEDVIAVLPKKKKSTEPYNQYANIQFNAALDQAQANIRALWGKRE